MMKTRLRFTALAILATSLVPAAAFAQQPTEAPPPVAPPTIGNGEAPAPPPADPPPPVPPPPPPPVIVAPDAPPPPPPLPTTPPEPLPPGPGPASPSASENPGVTNPFTPTPGAKGVGRGAFYFHVEPFVGIVGGAKLDNPIQQPSQNRDTRVSAIMLADFGVRGELSDWISFESEIMANGGTSLRGTSVYDGEASLQVRKQAIHLGKDKWALEVGRVVDEASVDYFSLHIADTFLQDPATRSAFLFSGYNLGNGIRGTYEVIDGLRVGLAANAGNPTSSSSVLAVGGTFPPFDRVYLQAAQKSRQDLNGYPDDQFHAYVLTPSVLFNSKYFEARTAAQMFMIDPNANDEISQNIRGYNIRANGRIHLLDDMISPYGNFSIDRNDVVDPTNATKLSADKYTGLSYGGGVDFNYMKRFGNFNGIGAQYMQTEQKTTNSNVTTNRYLNIGTTFWLHRNVAIGARFALWAQELKNVNTTGERSVITTLRLVL